MTLREHVSTIEDLLGQRHPGDRLSEGAIAQLFLSSRAFAIRESIARGGGVPPSAWDTFFLALENGDPRIPKCQMVLSCDRRSSVKLPAAIASDRETPLLQASRLDGTSVAYMSDREWVTKRNHLAWCDRECLVEDVRGAYLANPRYDYETIKVAGVFEDPTALSLYAVCEDGSPACADIMDAEVALSGGVASRAYEYVVRQARQGQIQPVDPTSDDRAEG